MPAILACRIVPAAPGACPPMPEFGTAATSGRALAGHWQGLGLSVTLDGLIHANQGVGVAMSATRWILGCALTAAVTSPAMASPWSSGAATQGIGAQHSSGAPSPARNVDSGGSGGGDVLRHDAADESASSSEAAPDGSSAPVGTSARQPVGHHSNVGWQSLLPGSIQ